MNQPDSLKHRTILNFARAFFNYNPRIVTLCVALLVLSGLMEAIGIVMLLPLISMTLTQNTDNPDFLTRAITQTFDRFGISFELHTALIVISTVILLKAIFIYLAQRVNAKLAVDFSKDMRLRLMNTVISSQWGHFVMRSTGRFANAITQQCTSIVNICNGVLNLYSMIFLSIIYLSIAVLSSVKVFLFSAAVGVFMFFVLKNIIRLTKIINARFVVNSEKLSDQLINSLNIFKPLKAMGQQNRITPFMHKEIDGMRDTTFKITLLSNFTTLVQEPIVVIFLSIGIFLIATVSSVEASFLIFSAVLYYRIVGKIGEIQARVQKLSGAQNNYWSVLELIEEGEKYQETSKTTTERLKLRKGLKLENLDFSYGKKAVLHNINLDLPLAGLITIMGPSGSGKTTLTDLICGLYTPSAGRILIDDTDIQDIDMIAWRHALGLVPQDTVLTNDTIYNNVTLFDHTIP
ncbi:MAG: ATP-binding cassette domain-containing protein, partial [Bdellovibrionales bacterium]